MGGEDSSRNEDSSIEVGILWENHVEKFIRRAEADPGLFWHVSSSLVFFFDSLSEYCSLLLAMLDLLLKPLQFLAPRVEEVDPVLAEEEPVRASVVVEVLEDHEQVVEADHLQASFATIRRVLTVLPCKH